LTPARERLPLIGLFAAGFAIRWLLAVAIWPDGGHRSDLQILTDWTHQLVANGPGGFYRPGAGYFADYPPLYLYVLWLTGLIGRAWSGAFGGPDVTPFMLKLPFMLADLGLAAVALLISRRLWGDRAGVIAAAVCLFNPALIFLSAVWAQNDSIAALLLLSAIGLLIAGRTEWATVVAVLVMLFKFQYGFAIPIVLIVGLRRHLLGLGDGDGIRHPVDLVRVGRSLLVGVVTLLVAIRPFGLYVFSPDDRAHSLTHRFLEASNAFPGVTQNAFNLWMNPLFDVIRIGRTGLTEGHIVDDTAVLLGSVTWQTVGNVLFVSAVLMALAVLLRRSDGIAILAVALTIAVAFFVLPTRIHERYLYPALVLGLPLLAAGIAWRRLYVALTTVLLLDVYWVYSLPVGNAGPGRGILGMTVFRPEAIYAIAAVATASMAWLLWRAADPETLPWAKGVVVEAVGPEPASQRTATVVAIPASLPFDRELERIGVWIRAHRPGAGGRTVIVLAVASLLAAILVARVNLSSDVWLWNLDLPKIDLPLASFFHDALAERRLPLWNDDLGLGYPLYAEGQIGAFYPPNWLIYLFPPLVALDVSRVVHLTILGLGGGLLTLRLCGSRAGALVTAISIVLGSSIAAKLQWTNLVAAYAWVPWILLPLVRRPQPTRGGLVVAGLLFGVQAWAGHPNTWLLTGLAAAIVLLAVRPTLRSLGRVIGFGLLGTAVGAVQLIPTLILTTLSVRSEALSPNDLFTSAATQFDVLLFAFQNAFARVANGAWDVYSIWYPDGTFALLEAAAYVGLPVLVLAAVAATARRARPFVLLIAVGLAIPIVAAFRPELWTHIPILDGLRSPVRSYLLVTFALAVLAGIGVARLGRARRARRRGATVLGVAIGAYAVVLAVAVLLPGAFDAVLLGASTFLGANDVPGRRDLAIAALTQPWPFLLEVAVGVATLGIVTIAQRRPSQRAVLGPAALVVVAIPLILLGPLPNPLRPLRDASFAGTDYVRAVAATTPARFVAIDPPGWYAGMPDQLAMARVHDLRMFSSLDLRASNDLVERIVRDDPDGSLRRAVGVDVIATFDRACPGQPIATVASEGDAVLCRDEAALRPPYLLPVDAVTPGAATSGSPIRPVDLSVDLGRALSDAVAVTPDRRDVGVLDLSIDTTAPGWLWVDRAWWPAWSTTVNGQPVSVARAMAGQLIPVPAGASVVRQRFVPWDAMVGGAIGALAIAIALAWWRGWFRVSPWARRRS
jgi:Gpi18-like mannosyltransferase